MEVDKLYKPKVALSAETLKQTAQNQYRAKAIENINNEFFQGIMSPSWYSDIDLWFKKYEFDEQLLLETDKIIKSKSRRNSFFFHSVAKQQHS